MERGHVNHELPQTSAVEHTPQQMEGRSSRLMEVLSRPLKLFRQPVIAAEGNRQHPDTPKSSQTTALGSSTQQRSESRATRIESTEAEVTEPSPAFVAEAISSRPSFETPPEQQDSDRNHQRRTISTDSRGAAALHHIRTVRATVTGSLAVLWGNKPSNTASREQRARRPADMLQTGYAVPRRPMQVLLARDEEAAGGENATNKLTPPAYGFWRESVRIDPNRLYWQRNEAARRQEPVLETESQLEYATRSGQRPPSYASGDGVSYVVDAMTASSTSTVTASRELVGR
ncbi:hypothetical protein G3M48_009755 [Beauveria asiatica]|uniref:Uncharacterized protein n=1 Tax=Beauveria asiatica TaxID=1069075 RepID=A0AAW0S373_9HYPO